MSKNLCDTCEHYDRIQRGPHAWDHICIEGNSHLVPFAVVCGDYVKKDVPREAQ